MNLEFAWRAPLTVCVLATLAPVIRAHAESDVLERPAVMRTASRSMNQVVLDIKSAGERLVAVGERGLILWSDDNGKQWKQANVPVSVTLTSLSFADDMHGWAAGHSGIVLGTSDGGKSWRKLLDGKVAAALVHEEAKKPGASSAFVAEAARLVADGADKPFLDIHFFDASNGLVVGAYGLAFSTADGGNTWHPLQANIDNPRSLHLYRIYQAGKEVFIAGEQGGLYASSSDGRFNAIKTPYQGSYFGVLQAQDKLIVFGMRGNAFWSDDKGSSWNKCDIPTNNTLTAGARLDDGRIALVDDGGNVLDSRDGGKHFIKTAMPKLPPLTAALQLKSKQVIFAGARGISEPYNEQLNAGGDK